MSSMRLNNKNKMGKPTGFLEFTRELPKHKDARERINEYKEFYLEFAEDVF